MKELSINDLKQMYDCVKWNNPNALVVIKDIKASAVFSFKDDAYKIAAKWAALDNMYDADKTPFVAMYLSDFERWCNDIVAETDMDIVVLES